MCLIPPSYSKILDITQVGSTGPTCHAVWMIFFPSGCVDSTLVERRTTTKIHQFFPGSLYYQPKQCTINRKSLKLIHTFWYRLIPPEWVPLNDHSTSSMGLIFQVPPIWGGNLVGFRQSCSCYRTCICPKRKKQKFLPGPSSLGAKWFRYRVSIYHPLGFDWHPLEGAASWWLNSPTHLKNYIYRQIGS